MFSVCVMTQVNFKGFRNRLKPMFWVIIETEVILPAIFRILSVNHLELSPSSIEQASLSIYVLEIESNLAS